MKIIKKDTEKKEEIQPIIEGFLLYKEKAPMVRIKGNFYGGGFNLSQNKAKAILANLNIIKDFANGTFDEEIFKLSPDEMLTL